MTWLTVGLSDNERFPLAVSFAYERGTVDLLKQEFDGSVRRYDPERRCWLFRRGQWDALCATFGDRLEVAPDAWRLLFPAKQKRNGDAR